MNNQSDLNSSLLSDKSDECFGLFRSLVEDNTIQLNKKPSRAITIRKPKPVINKQDSNSEIKNVLINETLLTKLNFTSLCTISSTNVVDGSETQDHCSQFSPGKDHDEQELSKELIGVVHSPQLFHIPGNKTTHVFRI